MTTTQLLPVKDLKLDLKNFRTVPQKDELSALRTMISINPDRFWALTDSLLDTGYLPTENIIVLKDKKGVLHVREGNRRIGALKLAFKYLSSTNLAIPKQVEEKFKVISVDWKRANAHIPCAVYEEKDEALVDRIITLAHGKGAKAGRDNWTSVARARHNRDKNKAAELGLDLLEKYLKNGTNLTSEERDQWSADYPVTVLDAAIPKIAPRYGYNNSGLVANYPAKNRKDLDGILRAIGTNAITFDVVRAVDDFGLKYGLPALPGPAASVASKKSGIATEDPSAQAAAEELKKSTRGRTPSAWITPAEARSYNTADRVKLMLLEMSKLKPNKNSNVLCPAIRVVCELALYDKLQTKGHVSTMIKESRAAIQAMNAKRAAAKKPLMNTIPNWTPSFGDMLTYLLDPARGLMADPQQSKALKLVVKGNTNFVDDLDNFIHNVSYLPADSDPEKLWSQFGRLLFKILEKI